MIPYRRPSRLRKWWDRFWDGLADIVGDILDRW